MKTAGRFILIAACFFFIASLFLSAVLFLSHSGHHKCANDDCAVCVHLSNISNNLKFTSEEGNLSVFCVFAFIAFAPFLKKNIQSFNNTLVCLKVQLNT